MRIAKALLMAIVLSIPLAGSKTSGKSSPPAKLNMENLTWKKEARQKSKAAIPHSSDQQLQENSSGGCSTFLGISKSWFAAPVKDLVESLTEAWEFAMLG
ncbi:MAG TPA: hypothetical protein VNL73_02190 [Verrucomicrobiae bacterium]|nr:hypothetical protein [Verrucomicrobiae bacterium]